MSSILTISGNNVASPIEMKVSIMDIDKESNRNASGTMIRHRVTTKRKICCKWGVLTTSQIKTILASSSKSSFKVTYLDPLVGGLKTIEAYAGDKTAPVLVYDKKAGYLWKELTVDYIEI